jgi:hypothetical protein
MKTKETEAFAKLVCQYYEDIAIFNKKKTVDYFIQQGKSKSTIYHILQRYEQTGQSEYKPNTGRTPSKLTLKALSLIQKTFIKNPNISLRQASKKLNIAKSTLSDGKVKKLGIKGRVKRKVPKYSTGQEKRAKKGCRYVYEKSLRKILIEDDETYIPFDPSQVPGRSFYHTSDTKQTNYTQKTKPKEKHTKRFLIWQAIDEEGHVSDPFISERPINADIYLKECLIDRLILFIDNYYKNEDIIFWQDLATCHYAKICTKFLRDKNIEFVPKEKNPPNVPQARGIERFWAICKQEYSRLQNKPRSLAGFIRIWKRISKKVAEKHGKAIMKSAKRRLRSIGRNGVQAENIN